MRQSLFLLGILLMLGNLCSSQTSSLCSKKGPKNSNDKIQEKVYEVVRLVKERKLADTTTKRLRDEYEDVKEDFNELYKTMSEDLGIFNARKKVCEKYSDQVQKLVEKGESYNQNAFAALQMQPPASVGGDDIIAIIEFLWKVGNKVADMRQESFYKAVEWKTWENIE